MSAINTGEGHRSLFSKHGRTLTSRRMSAAREAATGQGGATPLPTTFHAERIRGLLADGTSGSAAFQAAAVSALAMIDRVVVQERHLAEAAISLAQQERLSAMVHELEVARRAVTDVLNDKGAQMIGRRADADKEHGSDHSWWFSLTETIQTLEEAVDRTTKPVAGLPRGSRARVLSGIVARLFHSHQVVLLAEADQWIGSVEQ